MGRAYLLTVTLPALAACADQRVGVVSAFKEPCAQVFFPGLCTVITEDSGEVHRIPGLEGYDFRWGVNSRVEFNIEEIDDPPLDGPGLRYIHEDTRWNTWEAIGTQFELLFFPNPYDEPHLLPDVDGIVTMRDGTLVACAGALRDDLLTNHEQAFHVTFELTGAQVPLRCVSSRPWEPPPQ